MYKLDVALRRKLKYLEIDAYLDLLNGFIKEWSSLTRKTEGKRIEEYQGFTVKSFYNILSNETSGERT